MPSSDLNITIHYDLVTALFLRKSYGVHSKMYSVGYGSSARVIQSGTCNNRSYIFFGLTPLQSSTTLYALVTSVVSGNAEHQLRAV